MGQQLEVISLARHLCDVGFLCASNLLPERTQGG
jgi:hypothetical protein